MARQVINIGSSANDGTGDPLRTAFDKINDNFVELYGGDNDINTLDANLDVNNFAITTGVTNGDITITPNGTGSIKLGAMKFNGTTISSDDSSIVNINEGLVVDGTASISGAATLSTSLALASGATVTSILDEDAMGSNSATALATQQSIKAYVDSQVTAQDLDFTADDSTTNSIDLDSEVMQFSGDTGITTSATGNTVSIAIDGTVATLTGSQTLTNKVLTNPTINAATMTGAVAINGITLNDNTIVANASNSDLELDGSGTGAVKILADAQVVGTLTTADITNTNNITTTQLDADGVRLKDNTVSTFSSNANLEISANGSGVVDVKSAMTTIGQTVTGDINVTGAVRVDNIKIDANAIVATNSNGSILINPNGTGSITLGGNTVNVPSIMTAHTFFTDRELLMGPAAKIKPSVTNDDVVIEANGTGSVVLEEISITANTITTHNSNADLQIDTDGTGAIQLLTNTNVSGSLTATSLTTNEIASNGSNADINITPSGTGLVAISNLKVDGNIQINDNKIATTVSNSNLQLGANGTGNIDVTSLKILNLADPTGAQDAATKAYVDAQVGGAANGDLTFIGSTISAPSNANLTLNAGGTGSVDIDAIQIKGTSISSTDSTQININENVEVDGTLSVTGEIAKTGDLIVNVSGDIVLDADGGDVFLRDGAAGNYGSFTRAGSNDLTISSGSTQALLFTGANAAFQGTLSVAGGSTLDGVTITDNTIKSNASNADLQIGTSGTGVIDLLTATQATVGSAGGASALPGQPTGYIKVKIGGTMRVIPFYDES